jgi:hypothetical protein
LPLFDRQVSVLIGEAGAESALNVTELRVVFDVTKSTKREANSAKVTIYNLNPDQRSKLETAESRVVVKCGYAEEVGLEVLYRGDVSFVESRKEGVDWATVIESDDGQTVFDTTRVGLSFKEGATAKQVLRDILGVIPLAQRSAVVNSAIAEAVDLEYTNGYAATGNAFAALTKVTDSLSLEWSVQDGELKIIADGGTDGSRAIVISPDSGLIGSPQRRRKRKNGTTTVAGWSVRSLLQPKIEPGGVVSIEAAAIKPGAAFRVDSISHKGDTHGPEWVSELEVSDVG